MTPAVPWPDLQRGLVAILRGLQPEEAADVVRVLVDAGFEAVEIPLNSPKPFRSIEIARAVAPKSCLIGAGTVLEPDSVDRLASAGGELLVSPNVDDAVLARGAEHGMVTMPGVFSPTEALRAVSCGASALKFFPASVLGPDGVKAVSAILPADAIIGAVGGVSDADFAAYRAVGVRTFGLGSSLYAPGHSVAEIGRRALMAVAAYDRIFGEAQNDC